MRTFALIFMIIMIFNVIKGYKESRKDLEKLAKELSISENHPMHNTLWEFVFFNRFRFWMLLFVIFFTGLMVCYILL